jgi:predicted RNA binding protein YcfA (HicA-like mRNA interferase family)
MRVTPLKSKKFVKALKKLGFEEKRQTGSHLILYNPETKKTIPVPIHVKDLKVGLIRGVLREIEVSPEDFLKIIYKK